MAQVLLFDLGGVLVENDTIAALSDLTDGAFDRHHLHDKWLSSPSALSYGRGEIDSRQFCESFVEEWQLSISADEFAARFAQWPNGAFAGAENLLRKLRQKYLIAFLSNCNDLHWQRLAPILSWADHAFSSHLIGALKPDKKSFQHVADALGASFSQFIFFDDSLANVRAASDLGLVAYRTDGFAELLDVVESLQL